MRLGPVVAWRNRKGRYSDQLDPKTPLEQLAFFREALGDDGIEGKVVVEIGPGDALALGMLLLGLGATKYIAIDRFPGDLAGERAHRLYSELARVAPEEVRAGLSRTGRPAEDFPWTDGPEAPVVVLSQSIERADLGGVGPADVVVSYNVLEHLSDLAAAFVGMAKILRPGGRMVHRIDYGPHGFWRGRPNPLEFLAVPDPLWSAMGSARGMPNRHRHPEVMAALAAAGFDASATITRRFGREEVDRIHPRILPRYRAMSADDLEPRDAILFATKVH